MKYSSSSFLFTELLEEDLELRVRELCPTAMTTRKPRQKNMAATLETQSSTSSTVVCLYSGVFSPTTDVSTLLLQLFQALSRLVDSSLKSSLHGTDHCPQERGRTLSSHGLSSTVRLCLFRESRSEPNLSCVSCFRFFEILDLSRCTED